ncbi:Protein kinase domain-containing protein [Mycena indigotica]|uniref:Protein kinase domain-containing protein n=1 Tax=Mycena indigotica TaxID=2126181 RepID=A0A8H6VV08_9AGAR|nr:Protein kinase domain-containing protein [Mycena indigotica]KAF7294917.1 Protein kinase domain-containing protein [Mycena indigotica]
MQALNPPSPMLTDSSFDSDSDSDLEEDDDEVINARVYPCWLAYSAVLEQRGFRLDTVKEVRDSYSEIPDHFLRKHAGDREDALCPDAGLCDNLFRGSRTCDGLRVMVKAVHRWSREFRVICLLHCLREDPMNHCIPILDLIESDDDDVALIVMEQWSSQLIDDDGPCNLRLFIAAIRQCIEHVTFMHQHRIAHLDISLRNLLTDYKGHYAYIDYELSRCFDSQESICIHDFRSTEIPPECEHGECRDPFKADVWALAILILRACKLAGYCIPEFLRFTQPMLHSDLRQRPSMTQVLAAYDEMVSSIGDLDRLPSPH